MLSQPVRVYAKGMRRRSYWGSEGAGILPVSADQGTFLVGLRSRYVVEPGTWGTIGGKRNDNDVSSMETALREFVEETKYTGEIEMVPLLQFVDPGKFTYTTYLGIVPTEIKDLCPDHETDAFQWVSYAALCHLDNKHPGLELVIDAVGDVLQEFANATQHTMGESTSYR